MSQAVKVDGLKPLVAALKGPAFRDVNKELRKHARLIANDMAPLVAAAVRKSHAPQAAAMSATVRPHSDRVPVVVVGKTNPRFSSGFSRRGSNSRARRGALARGVVSGPAGGKRSTRANENYYRIRRDPSWGPLGDAIDGPILRDAEVAYLKLYIAALKAHGFDAKAH